MGRIKKIMNNIDTGKYTSREMLMAGVILFLLGTVIGMLCSPRKNQVFGSYNGNGVTDVLENEKEIEE